MDKVLARAQRDGLETNDPQAVLKEYERFLQLAAASRGTGEASVPPPHVDSLWHAHLLHTQDYAQKCKELGCNFIDHEPWDPARGEEVIRADFMRYQRTLERYEEMFGETAPSSIWPKDADARDMCETEGSRGWAL